jgi:hypothetical protein
MKDVKRNGGLFMLAHAHDSRIDRAFVLPFDVVDEILLHVKQRKKKKREGECTQCQKTISPGFTGGTAVIVLSRRR